MRYRHADTCSAIRSFFIQPGTTRGRRADLDPTRDSGDMRTSCNRPFADLDPRGVPVRSRFVCKNRRMAHGTVVAIDASSCVPGRSSFSSPASTPARTTSPRTRSSATPHRATRWAADGGITTDASPPCRSGTVAWTAARTWTAASSRPPDAENMRTAVAVVIPPTTAAAPGSTTAAAGTATTVPGSTTAAAFTATTVPGSTTAVARPATKTTPRIRPRPPPPPPDDPGSTDDGSGGDTGGDEGSTTTESVHVHLKAASSTGHPKT